MKRQLKLLKLELKNFKGVRHFGLNAKGKNIKVFGDNATGKTSLFDAFIWLLFDKDSNNKSKFALKTLDATNNELHGLEHEVEGVFNLDGQEITLRKVFSEKWTKKRGSATKEFTGHTTDYYIDDVPSKLKEYQDKVSQIVDESVFKLLTSPAYFNEQLKWEERRKILLEVCGDISDNEVIAQNNKLADLPDILSGKSIESLKKIIASKRSEINKELDRIPIRIDEVQRTMPDISDLNEQNLTDEITRYKSWIEDKEAEISRIQNGSEVSLKEKQLREIEIELLDLKNNQSLENNEKVNGKRRELYDLQDKADRLRYELDRKKRELSEGTKTVEALNIITERLRTEWREVNSKTFEFCQDTNCPACGQALPDEKLVAAREKAQADFNQDKAKKLEAINAQGKIEATRLADITARNELYSKEITTKELELVKMHAEISSMQDHVSDLQSEVVDVEKTADYQAKQKEVNAIKLAINELKSSTSEAVSKVRSEIASLRAKVETLENEKTKFNLVKQAKERISELAEQERKLAKEFEKLEQQLFLTEEFIRCKVQLLEEKINSKFRYARFKLFDQQINDGLRENCETLYNGIPYSSGLNNAARINIGLDIINTLSDHYGFSAPIFVDNSEAVTKLIDVNSQVICLVVSEADKELRVEI